MKRSRKIDLNRMKKRSAKFKLINRWLLMTGGGLALAGCGEDPIETRIYQSLEQCGRDNPGQESLCASAYQKALTATSTFAPKYHSYDDCRAEFQDCIPAQEQNGQQRFMPSMQAFALAMDNDEDCDDEGFVLESSCYYTSPLYIGHGKKTRKGYYNAKGMRYGSVGKTSFMVRTYRDSFSAPKSTRTLSRGGFGSRVSARSSSGG